MKKTVSGLLLTLLIVSCATTPPANPDEVSLNTAIRQAAAQMETRLDSGTKIALINFTSPSQAFSEYVLDELSSVLVNNGVLVVVDRASLDKVRQELNFNMSGEVSDQSAQEIGKMLGAEAIVTGSLTSIGELKRVMFKTIITETAAVVVQHPADITNDQRVKALLAGGGGSQTLTYGEQTGTAESGQPRTPGTAPAPISAYKIGDTGPAGGLIFYDKGSSIGGWRYLEAAPADLGPAIACNERLDDLDYGRFRQMIDNARGVGRGKYNTEYIMADARKLGGGFGWAAQLCDTYELGGFDDWFLPSQDELNYMYGNLFLRELGNFREDTYWSSTPAYWDNTWMDINLSNGSQTRTNGMDKKRVRPCRQF